MAKIIMDEKVRHGKPVVAGTRITADDVLGWLESGMDYDEIEQEYGINKDCILSVINYAS